MIHRWVTMYRGQALFGIRCLGCGIEITWEAKEVKLTEDSCTRILPLPNCEGIPA